MSLKVLLFSEFLEVFYFQTTIFFIYVEYPGSTICSNIWLCVFCRKPDISSRFQRVFFHSRWNFVWKLVEIRSANLLQRFRSDTKSDMLGLAGRTPHLALWKFKSDIYQYIDFTSIPTPLARVAHYRHGTHIAHVDRSSVREFLLQVIPLKKVRLSPSLYLKRIKLQRHSTIQSMMPLKNRASVDSILKSSNQEKTHEAQNNISNMGWFTAVFMFQQLRWSHWASWRKSPCSIRKVSTIYCIRFLSGIKLQFQPGSTSTNPEMKTTYFLIK